MRLWTDTRRSFCFGARPWYVRLIRKGDVYGLEDCLVHHEAEPMIEFFDGKQDPKIFGALGQFVSRYHVETLRETGWEANGPGLGLHGGVPAWTVSANEVLEALAWVEAQGE